MSENLSQQPHQLLPQYRQENNLSIDQVADALHVKLATIKLLEAGEYAQLYGDAYVCGLVRSYASLLKVDAEAMIAAYKHSSFCAEVKQPMDSFAIAAYSKLQHKSYKTLYGLLAVIIVVFVFGYFVKESRFVKHSDPNNVVAIETANGSTVVGSIANMPVENPTEELVEDNTPTADSAVITDTSEIVNPVAPVAPQHNLSFYFTGDSWVEVVDNKGVVLVSALQKMNQTLQLQGEPPLAITLGNAGVVKVFYNNEAVAVTVGQSDVAKLIVGNQ